jgi:hypothetical protein
MIVSAPFCWIQMGNFSIIVLDKNMIINSIGGVKYESLTLITEMVERFLAANYKFIERERCT